MSEDLILRRQPEEDPEHYPQFFFICNPERVEEARALLLQIPGIQLKDQPKDQTLQKMTVLSEEETITGYEVRGYCSEANFEAVITALSGVKIAGYSRASQVLSSEF